MANYATLIAAIQSVITQNGNNEITGPILQQTLISVVNSLGSGYQFIGIATPETTPGTPDQKVFYIGASGTYPNFGPAVIPDGNLAVFYYDSSWHYGSVAFPLGDGAVTESKVNSAFLAKLLSGYVFIGVASPNMNPGTPTRNCFYLTTTTGTYTYFGGITVVDGEIAALTYNTDLSQWSKDSISIPQMVEIVNNFSGGIDKALSAEMGKYLKVLLGDVEATYNTVSISGLTTQNCSLGVGGWYRSPKTTGKQRHIALPVLPGERYRLSCITDGAGWYGFVTSSYSPPYSNGNAIPYVTGTDRARLDNGNVVIVDVPLTAAYLILTTVDGSDYPCTWTVEKVTPRNKTVQEQIDDINTVIENVPTMEENVQDLLDYVDIPEYDIGQEINLSNYSSQYCSLGANGWWRDPATTGPQRHIAVPVTPGKMYKVLGVVVSGGSATVFCAWVTSSYSPPYAKNDAIPYVSGTGRIVFNNRQNGYIEAPPTAAYLILTTVDGYPSTVNWRMWETSETGDRKTLEERLEIIEGAIQLKKIRVASWNIGHFSLGASSDTAVTQAQYEEMRQKWAVKLNELCADILGCCEYNTNFVNASGDDPAIPARSSVFALFNYARIGTKYSYNQQAIFSNILLGTAHEVIFSQASQNRYYYWCEIKIGGKTVVLVETHLDFNNASYRAAQIAQLISAFANNQHVIIGGDFNIDAASEYEAFTNAGYTVANHGYIGDVSTYPASEPARALDNIVCKGFAMGNIQKICDPELSDHCCVYVDLTLE